MKQRTIEELHDKYIGHKKMASICDILISDGYKITEIKEYNEQFKFKVNDHQFWYRKDWKSSAKEYVKYIINLLEAEKELKKLYKENLK